MSSWTRASVTRRIWSTSATEPRVFVDPPRFPDAQERLADRLGLRLAWTVDTHSHADYVTGSPGLVHRRHVVFLAPAASRLESPHRPLADGDRVELAPGDRPRRDCDSRPHTRSPRLRADRVWEPGRVVLGWLVDGRRSGTYGSVRTRTRGTARARDVPRAAAASTRSPTIWRSTRPTAPARSAPPRDPRPEPAPSATNARPTCSSA